MKEAPNAKGRVQQKMKAVRLKLRKRPSELSGLYSMDVKNNGVMPHNKIVKAAEAMPRKLSVVSHVVQ